MLSFSASLSMLFTEVECLDRFAAASNAGFRTLERRYRNMWRVSHNPRGAFTARGIHGQGIEIDPAANMVTMRFASHPLGVHDVRSHAMLVVVGCAILAGTACFNGTISGRARRARVGYGFDEVFVH